MSWIGPASTRSVPFPTKTLELTPQAIGRECRSWCFPCIGWFECVPPMRMDMLVSTAGVDIEGSWIGWNHPVIILAVVSWWIITSVIFWLPSSVHAFRLAVDAALPVLKVVDQIIMSKPARDGGRLKTTNQRLEWDEMISMRMLTCDWHCFSSLVRTVLHCIDMQRQPY